MIGALPRRLPRLGDAVPHGSTTVSLTPRELGRRVLLNLHPQESEGPCGSATDDGEDARQDQSAGWVE